MKRLLSIWFLVFLSLGLYAQKHSKIEYLRVDSALMSKAFGTTIDTLIQKYKDGTYYYRLVRNPVDSTDAVNLRTLQDTLLLYVLYSDTISTIATKYDLDTLTISLYDSISVHTVRYYAVLDSIGRHTVNYYTIQDTVIQNMADIAALQAGDNHIGHNAWFTGINAAGDTSNLWRFNEYGNLEIAPDVLLQSAKSRFDPGMISRTYPLRTSEPADSTGERIVVGDMEISKDYIVPDGAGGGTPKHERAGDIYSAGVLVSTEKYFYHELTADAENDITVDFTLLSTSKVFFNGQRIPNSLWSGEEQQR